jgi:hypothetical protein
MVLLLGALCSAAGLFAKDAPASTAKTLHPDHEVLDYVPTDYKQEFTGSNGLVTVTWKWTGEVRVGGKDHDLYDCVITQAQNPTSHWGYSLYTLGVQGRLWKVEVTSAAATAGNNVVITPGAGAAFNVSANPDGTLKALLPAACRSPAPAAHKPPEPDRVAFLSFTGSTCTLKLRSERVRHGPRTKTSHDATPPPPDGGGEN